MSPEQVEGKEADARSDIFALGAVLYEMATGKRAFEGKTTASVIAAVLEREPEPISTVRPMSPPALDRLVKACVAKDPDDRIQTVHDVKLQLKWMADGGSQTGIPITVAKQRKTRERLAWAVAALALLSFTGLGIFHFGSQKTAPGVVAQIYLPPGLAMNFIGDFAAPPALSPDGRHAVFGAVGQGVNRLYIRALDNLAVTPLPGTENATYPFWSPDNRSIGFFSGGKLKRMDISGGVPVALCDAPAGRGGSWNQDGVILFTPALNAGIMRIAASGGAPVEVLKVDMQRYSTLRWPWWLPDGKHFLYLAAKHESSSSPDTRTFVASLDGKENRPLLPNLSNAIYASGYLLFVRGNALMAQAFDLGSLQLKGEPATLSDSAQADPSIWHSSITASGNGALLYQAGAADSMKLERLDRGGQNLGVIETEATDQVALSPDEKKLAYITAASAVIYAYDLARKISTPLTFTTGMRHADPVWSADGSQIAYVRQNNSNGATGIYARAASGAGGEVELLPPVSGDQIDLCDWSRDGRYLVFVRGANLWVLPLFGERKAFPYMAAPVTQESAVFSPDGRWIAYSSFESGQSEVYVAPFPATGAKWQVSAKNGDFPQWRSDGKELFFLAGNPSNMMAAAVNSAGSGGSFEVGELHALFRANLAPGLLAMKYSPSKNGQQFLVVTGGEQSSTPLVLVQNWTEKLKK